MMSDMDEDIKVKNDEYQSLLKRIYPNEDQPKTRKERCEERLRAQIEYKIKKNDSVFYIDKEEEDIFDEVVKERPEFKEKIDFIMMG